MDSNTLIIILSVVFLVLLIMHWSERGMCKFTADKPIYVAMPLRLLNYLLCGLPGLIANMALIGEYEFVPVQKKK